MARQEGNVINPRTAKSKSTTNSSIQGVTMSRGPFSYTIGEYIDKLTILSKKDLCNLPGASTELEINLQWLKDRGIDADMLLSIIRIAQTNMDIWHLEHSVRNAAEGSIPLHEVGRRAIMIRSSNKIRVHYKNVLDSSVKGGLVEEKIKHLSEDLYTKFYEARGIQAQNKTIAEGGVE
jgi:hypothetical protein